MPTTIVAAAGAAWASASAAVAAASWTTIISTAFTVASIGFSAVQSYQQQQAAKRARAAAQAGLDQQGLQFVSRSTVAPWQTVYGRVYKSGPVFFEAVKPPHYYVGVILASHRIDGIEKFYINGREITVDDAGNVTSAPFYRNGISRARISVRLGLDDQAVDPLILADFPSVGAEFRQRGHATLVLRADYGADIDEFQAIWNGEVPAPAALIRGKRVYDPRDPLQDPAAPATWRWSLSPTLIAVDYLRSEFGGRLAGVTWDWATIGASAAHDQSHVATLTGTEPRYEASGVVDTTAAAIDGIRALLLTNRGRFVDSPDGMAILSGGYASPVYTIHDGLLRGGLELQADAARAEIVNTIRTRLINPDSQYQVADGPVYQDAKYLAADGQAYEKTLALEWVQGVSRGQRLAKAFVEDARRGRSLRTLLELEAMQLEPGDVVVVDLTVASAANGLYMVERVAFAEAFTAVAVDLVEFSNDIYAFDPAKDEKPFTFEVKEV